MRSAHPVLPSQIEYIPVFDILVVVEADADPQLPCGNETTQGETEPVSKPVLDNF